MSLIGTFIGINKFADPSIRELAGCARDAQALWALFSDTIPEMQSELLVDTAATFNEIRAALDKSLGKAGPDDTVVISFSGHGTPDHRLVVHDTSRQKLVETTIEMAELSRKFRESKAKAVLCILDCCFSGEAPARVLDGAPAVRGQPTPLEMVAGNGRLLIAASASNEPALEWKRHGLLSRALIEALQSESSSTSLPSLMDTVMQRVRAEASRLGHTQTPVLFGHIEGGFSLPSLKKGKRFFAAFPESKGVSVSSNIMELSVFGLPTTLLNTWQQRFPAGLNDLQLSAVNEHRVLDGQSLLVVAPTSSGKTFIGEMAAAKAIVEGRKAIFLFPYKALTNEKFDQFTKLYGGSLGMRVIRCTGDYSDQSIPFVRGKYDLALLTYEMFLNISLSNPAILDVLGLLVVDELQFIADNTRGIAVELLLTHMLAARERGVSPQIITLSAVIGGLNDFDLWLGSEKLVSQNRPVPLVEGVLGRSGSFRFLDVDGREKQLQLVPEKDIVQRRSKPSSQDIIVPLVKSILASNPDERVIVFRNARGPAEGCAKYLAADLGLPPASQVAGLLSSMDMSSSSQSLRQCLAGGTAFHTGDLDREERVIVEQAFREPNGNVKILAATTTVAAGINTPASTVILVEHEFYDEESRPFTVAEYKNMAGRAGRLGFRETGRAILLADTSSEEDSLFENYVLAQPEPLRSSFDLSELETWILRLLAQVRKVPRNQIINLLASTYGGYVSSKSNQAWQQAMADRLSKILEQMFKLGLVEEELGFIKLTILGQACGRSSLGFISAMRLVSILKEATDKKMIAEDLMVLIQALPELDKLYTPLFKRGTSESKWPHETQKLFGYALAQSLQRQAATQLEYFARCKRAVILKLWIGGQQIGDIERNTTTNQFQGRIRSGDIRRFAESTRFHLRPAHEIATTMLLSNAPDEQSMDQLLSRLEFGLPADCLNLLHLGIPLDRGEYLALRNAGLKTPDEVWKLSAGGLDKVLSKSRVEELQTCKKP